MTKNDPTFLKLQRIERLIDQKRASAVIKKDLSDYLAEKTQPLKDQANLVKLSFDIDDKLEELLDQFDHHIELVEKELLGCAA